MIREANGGTLFLDEVGELSIDLQKVFLRILQERRFRPVGLEKEVACDFRLIAATNRDLEKMVEQGGFRHDLLYRIRTFDIDLPPLRQRQDDIRELAVHFIRDHCQREGIKTKEISPTIFETLQAYPWPGNIRELMGALDSALTTARFEPMLYSRHLPENIRVYQARRLVDAEHQPVSSPQRKKTDAMPSLQTVREAAVERTEKSYLAELMTFIGGDISAACDLAGISRSRLYDLLKKYDLR